MPDRLRWVQDSADHWNVLLDSEVVCDVTRTDQYRVASPDDSIAGAHSSLESAAAQVHGWVRWTGR
jgi:hypothetical protein